MSFSKATWGWIWCCECSTELDLSSSSTPSKRATLSSRQRLRTFLRDANTTRIPLIRLLSFFKTTVTHLLIALPIVIICLKEIDSKRLPTLNGFSATSVCRTRRATSAPCIWKMWPTSYRPLLVRISDSRSMQSASRELL